MLTRKRIIAIPQEQHNENNTKIETKYNEIIGGSVKLVSTAQESGILAQEIGILAQPQQEDLIQHNEPKLEYTLEPIIEEKPEIYYDELNSKYIIQEDEFTNKDILDIILKKENHPVIEKYIFSIKGDDQDGYEYEFTQSTVTKELEIMMKIQNYIYEIIQQYDHISLTKDDTSENKNNIIFFYYQLIIFFYKYILPQYETVRSAKIGATLTYRMSSIILKNILSVQDHTDKIQNYLIELADAKNSIITKLDALKISSQHNSNKTTLLNTDSEEDELDLDEDKESSDESSSSDLTGGKTPKSKNMNITNITNIDSELFSRIRTSERENNYYEEVI